MQDQPSTLGERTTTTFGRIDDLKTRLKAVATGLKANFKETFAGLGEVSVSASREKTFKGNLPIVVPEVWNALPKKERDTLEKKGIVKMEPSYTGAFYGKVEVKLF